jgi:hypothetical protein
MLDNDNKTETSEETSLSSSLLSSSGITESVAKKNKRKQ